MTLTVFFFFFLFIRCGMGHEMIIGRAFEFRKGDSGEGDSEGRSFYTMEVPCEFGFLVFES